MGDLERPLGRFVVKVDCRQPAFRRANNAMCSGVRTKVKSEEGESETD